MAAIAGATSSIMADVMPFAVFTLGVIALLFAEGVAWLINHAGALESRTNRLR